MSDCRCTPTPTLPRKRERERTGLVSSSLFRLRGRVARSPERDGWGLSARAMTGENHRPSFRGAREREPGISRDNFQIPGSMLRIAPE